VDAINVVSESVSARVREREKTYGGAIIGRLRTVRPVSMNSPPLDFHEA
jgi:hypothetical protein